MVRSLYNLPDRFHAVSFQQDNLRAVVSVNVLRNAFCFLHLAVNPSSSCMVFPQQ